MVTAGGSELHTSGKTSAAKSHKINKERSWDEAMSVERCMNVTLHQLCSVGTASRRNESFASETRQGAGGPPPRDPVSYKKHFQKRDGIRAYP